MSERMSDEVVRRVALLARLDITDDEVHHFAEQLDAVVDHFEDIEALQLDDVPPSTHAIPIVNVFRTDEVRPGLSRDEALASAPMAEDGRYRVPRILGEEP